MKTVPGVVIVAGPGKVAEEMYVAELESVVKLQSEPGIAVQETPGMELMDIFESVVDFGREQATVLGHCFEAEAVLQLGVWMTEFGWVVLPKRHGMQQLLGSELQAGSALQAELGTGAEFGAEAELKAEQSVAGTLENSHWRTELAAGIWLVALVSRVTICSVFVRLYLLLWWTQWWWCWCWPLWLLLPMG